MIFDEHYTMSTSELSTTAKGGSGYYGFDGYSNTKIFRKNEIWKMELLTGNSSYAFTSDLPDYPFGTQEWNFVTPDYSGTAFINLNGCDDMVDFNCFDGSCVSINTRHEEYMF